MLVRWMKKFKNSDVFSSVLILALFLIFNSIFIKGFLNIQIRDGRLFGITIDVLYRAAPLMIISIGMTLVIATKGIDLSVGAIVAISAAVAANLIGGELLIENGVIQYVTQSSLPVAILLALGAASICGLWNGFLVGKVKLQAIIATLILMVAGRGIAQLITDGQIITIYYQPYNFIGNGYFLGLPITIFIALFFFLIISLFIRKTALGMYIESIGINDRASRYIGINSQKIKYIVYIICGLCAGAAGIIISAGVRSADANNVGLWIELDAILAVVIGGNSLNGGKFTIAGSVIGAIIVQMITTTVYAAGITPEVSLVVKASFVLVLTLIQSQVFRNYLTNIFTNGGDVA